MAEGQSALTEAVYYILLSLFEPMHGYGIMQNVKQLSSGRVSLGAGTLYGAMNTLVEKGWISPCSQQRDERKKEYIITAAGRDAVEAEIQRLGELLQNGRLVMGGSLK